MIINSIWPHEHAFYQPESPEALPSPGPSSLTAIQEKFARILMTVAAELWLRSQLATAEEVIY